jgi:hypothetical protein
MLWHTSLNINFELCCLKWTHSDISRQFNKFALGKMFIPNKDKSAASFCHQAAAQLADIFCKFYLVQNHKIDNSLTTAEAG